MTDALPSTETLDPISVALLSFIKVALDDNGAWEWNPRVVGIVSGIVLFAIRSAFHKAHGIDWFSFVNAVVTGLGAAAVIYLDFFASEKMTGIAEPLRATQCYPPLTSLHRILPAIAMGYAAIDVVDGFTVGIDFLIHGILTASVMLFFCELDRPQIVAPFIIMECSTIFLNLVRAKFLSEKGCMIMQLLFAATFAICRIFLVPPLHFKAVRALFAAGENDCDAPYFKYVVLIFGLCFNW
eukprot:CAMPEP_0119007922 /NCGR_PEP_ID=MMETSP1176-20130426/3339_1 /TAXON_ID=265551 /ORGANISM="Synedropsis recta cf, Strain CCMP1620" /LENGTH=239 /DNA_ID=CAMNT_0006960157 /DNA_START=32 /DNA_END=748 /DNA_ORIENTATION=-